MNTFSHVPPGFRFHPTDEELVDYYLRRKITSRHIDLDVIKDVDLYRIEPWDLRELCRIGTEDENEWYFFSHKDKKYPTGTRTNRATAAGFWKATGRDKAIYSKHDLIGMRKTLVFYKGRAPNGQKSDWIMHEYRLETDENGTSQEEGWVVCRVFKKRIASTQKFSEHDSPIWYEDHHVSFMQDMSESPKQQQQHSLPNNLSNYFHPYKSLKKLEMSLQYNGIPSDHFLHHHHLPLLESPKMLHPQPQASASSFGGININPRSSFHSSSGLTRREQVHQMTTHDQNLIQTSLFRNNCEGNSEDHQVTDWRVLDKFVASQFSQDEEVSNENDTFPPTGHELISRDLNMQEMLQENGSTSSSSCQIDLWN